MKIFKISQNISSKENFGLPQETQKAIDTFLDLCAEKRKIEEQIKPFTERLKQIQIECNRLENIIKNSF